MAEGPSIHTAYYNTFKVRLSSFSTWPKGRWPDPKELALAGFFYEGSGDSVCCFACNIRLNEWKQHDDPWIEHAMWSPNCQHVKRLKGHDFVDMVNTLKHEHFVEQRSEDRPQYTYSTNSECTISPDNNVVLDLCCVCKRNTADSIVVPCQHRTSMCIPCSMNVGICPSCEKTGFPMCIRGHQF